MLPCPSPACRRVRWLALPLLAVTLLFFAAGCASTPPYVYRYVPGRTATVADDGIATVPPRAPGSVAVGIEAGNRIAGSSYVYGGGHGGDGSGGGGFDCSGSVSYILRAMGRLRGSMPSSAFRHYGERGPGRWVSVYARRGHVFLVVAGLRFDTGYHGGEGGAGPRWTEHGRPADGYVIRHPAGL